jgi:hypothetical protein
LNTNKSKLDKSFHIRQPPKCGEANILTCYWQTDSGSTPFMDLAFLTETGLILLHPAKWREAFHTRSGEAHLTMSS